MKNRTQAASPGTPSPGYKQGPHRTHGPKPYAAGPFRVLHPGTLVRVTPKVRG